MPQKILNLKDTKRANKVENIILRAEKRYKLVQYFLSMLV